MDVNRKKPSVHGTRQHTHAFTELTGTPPASLVVDGDKGDITVASSGATWTIDNNAVTYAKMQDVTATSRVIGRKTAGSGDPEELTLSETLDFVGSAAQGDILYRGAATWARLAAGTSGQFLQTLGTGANPAWASAGALLERIDYTDVGSAVANVEHVFGTGTYAAIIAIANDADPSAAPGAASLDHTLRYSGAGISNMSSPSFATTITAIAIWVPGHDASTMVSVGYMFYGHSTAASYVAIYGSNANEADRVRWAFSTGNIDSGKFYTYGIRRAAA